MQRKSRLNEARQIKAWMVFSFPFRAVESIESAIASANEIGYPVALKVVSEEILHKTDAGGVMLGIASDSALKGSYKQLAANIKKAAPNLSKMRVLVQKMIP